uniref:C-JID domain-containing protein n=1 Tax=Fagus sylvatica TaxID=28930 RepID=A0A2N9F0T7_FAGSY
MGIWSDAGSLQSLPKFPSLQSLPKFPSTSPTMLEIGIWSDPGSQLYRCGENNCGVGFTILTRYLQGRLSQKAGYETSTKRKEDGSGDEFQLIIPAYEIPRWLTHQRIGNSINIELPPNWCNSRWMGLALCACLDKTYVRRALRKTFDLIAHVTALGDMPHSHYTFEISSSVIDDKTALGISLGHQPFEIDHQSHIWLLYVSRDTLFATVRNGECSQIRVSFKCVAVRMCGARLVYEQDVEEFNQTIAQCESSHKKRRLSENL